MSLSNIINGKCTQLYQNYGKQNAADSAYNPVMGRMIRREAEDVRVRFGAY